MSIAIPAPVRSVRCAIYTRKSVKEGLQEETNSLEVQRDICSAYIRSQKHRRWIELEQRYDDGGYSGGTMVRPALQRLFSDVEQGFVDVVVIYKLDRLTRSLADFIRIIDILEQFGVTFVSVTQSFDTQDSMGRLVLNILLTFAQFEREMLADRIRDKMAAMKRAGRWTGGAPPFGYDVVDAKLVVNAEEAAVVRAIYERYAELQCSLTVTKEFEAEGLRSKAWTNRRGDRSGGGLATRGMIYGVLGSPLYVGEIHHHGEVFQGLHVPIVERELWERVQGIRNARKLKQPPARPHEHLLLGFIQDDVGRRMRINIGTKQGRTYRYYFSDQNAATTRSGVKQIRAEAGELERLVLVGVCSFLRRRFDLAGAIYELGIRDADTDRMLAQAPAVACRLEALDRRRLRSVWEALVDRVEVSRQSVRVLLRVDALSKLLAWSGRGIFRPTSGGAPGNRVHVLELDAEAVRSERTFKLPIEPRLASSGKPNRGLVELMAMARRVQAAVFENRELSIAQVAGRFRRKPAFVARVLCLNYLAPDIIAAIVDGRQPPELTRKKLIYSTIPMSWPQQRAMFGFPPQRDPSATDVHY